MAQCSFRRCAAGRPSSRSRWKALRPWSRALTLAPRAVPRDAAGAAKRAGRQLRCGAPDSRTRFFFSNRREPSGAVARLVSEGRAGVAAPGGLLTARFLSKQESAAARVSAKAAAAAETAETGGFEIERGWAAPLRPQVRPTVARPSEQQFVVELNMDGTGASVEVRLPRTPLLHEAPPADVQWWRRWRLKESEGFQRLVDLQLAVASAGKCDTTCAQLLRPAALYNLLSVVQCLM